MRQSYCAGKGAEDIQGIYPAALAGDDRLAHRILRGVGDHCGGSAGVRRLEHRIPAPVRHDLLVFLHRYRSDGDAVLFAVRRNDLELSVGYAERRHSRLSHRLCARDRVRASHEPVPPRAEGGVSAAARLADDPHARACAHLSLHFPGAVHIQDVHGGIHVLLPHCSEHVRGVQGGGVLVT